jgi:hypothetical protein
VLLSLRIRRIKIKQSLKWIKAIGSLNLLGNRHWKRKSESGSKLQRSQMAIYITDGLEKLVAPSFLDLTKSYIMPLCTGQQQRSQQIGFC